MNRDPRVAALAGTMLLVACDPSRFRSAPDPDAMKDASVERADAESSRQPQLDAQTAENTRAPSDPDAGPRGRAGGPAPSSDAGRGRDAGSAGAPAAGGAAVGGKDASEPAAADDLPRDAILWFAADRGVTADDDDRVSAWKSQTSGGYVAVPPTDDTPELTTDDAGRRWLDFDGADALSLPQLPPIAALSLFAVANAREPENWRCPSILHLANRASGTVTQTERIEFGRHMREPLYQVESVEITVPSGSGQFSPVTPHLLGVVHGTDANARLRVDGKQLHAQMTELPASLPRSFNFIGDNQYYSDSTTRYCKPFDGQIAEIILYPRGVSDEERDRIERYLADKWGVALK